MTKPKPKINVTSEHKIFIEIKDVKLILTESEAEDLIRLIEENLPNDYD